MERTRSSRDANATRSRPVEEAPPSTRQRQIRRRLPSLTGLRAFEAAARHGSISKAADELCVTHAAVSRHVAKLEYSLNAQLFERKRQRVVLTGRGAAYASQLQRIFNDLYEVTRQQFDLAADSTALRIGVLSTFAMRFLIPRLATFRERYPDIVVHIESSHHALDPRSSDVDVAIWLGNGNWAGLTAMTLFDEELLPVASPALLAQHKIESIHDLRHFLFLQVEARPDDWGRWLSAVGATDIDGSAGLRLEYSALAYEGAVNALGIAMAQTMFVKDDIAQHRLVAAIDKPVRTGRTYYAVYVDSNRRQDAIARFVHWLKSQAATASTPNSGLTAISGGRGGAALSR